MTVCPAIDSVPVRDTPVVGSTLNMAAPDPVPMPEPTIVIQLVWLCAIQEHPTGAVTATCVGPPAWLTFKPVVANE